MRSHKSKRTRNGKSSTSFSAMQGIGSLLCLQGNYFSLKTGPTSIRHDRLALQNDWDKLGRDFRKSLMELSGEKQTGAKLDE